MSEAADRAPSTFGAHLPAIFLRTARARPEATAALHFEGGHWRTTSWGELEAQARVLAEGLLFRGVEPGDRVSVMAQTSLQWIVCELAIHFVGAVCVPIYSTLLANDLAYVVRDSGLAWPSWAPGRWWIASRRTAWP